MGRYIIRRLLQAIPLLVLVSVGMFTLLHLIPGGPEAVLFNPHLTAAGRAALRARFGLDDPVYIQYFKWISRALVGDFGFSFATNEPVTTVLARRFPASLQLFTFAFALALVVGIGLGILSAVRQGTITDYSLITLSYFGLSMPVFLFGLLLQFVFGVWLHVLPTSGTATLGYQLSPFDAFVDHLEHLILPVLVLGVGFIAEWSRFLRASMIDVIKQDYMRTARAKGVAPMTLLLRHALRNAVIPLITVIALEFGAVAGGATITEGVFAWPGVGQLLFSSLEVRDFPVLLAMLMLGAVFVITFNLLADILYAVVDPRIRYS